MRRFPSLLLWSVLCAVLCGLPPFSQPARAQRFEFPELDGYRLDACLSRDYQCGKPAADAFCKDKGFDGAKEYAFAIDIGLLTPTITFSDRKICRKAECDGFRYILCGGSEDAEPDARRFDHPAYEEYRLDYCLFQGEECGKPAADAFCRENGYSGADSFDMDENIGEEGEKTMSMADGRVCDKPDCDGFKFIRCVPRHEGREP